MHSFSVTVTDKSYIYFVNKLCNLVTCNQLLPDTDRQIDRQIDGQIDGQIDTSEADCSDWIEIKSHLCVTVNQRISSTELVSIIYCTSTEVSDLSKTLFGMLWFNQREVEDFHQSALLITSTQETEKLSYFDFYLEDRHSSFMFTSQWGVKPKSKPCANCPVKAHCCSERRGQASELFA